ncbi:MAG TPA: hypothetical protein VNZ58_08650 [Thermomicrobiales bacterium]|nr:hypothetical protein [Thermomicrobiales bacterium]
MNNDRWEYHVKHSDSPLTEEQLNQLGAQGWELAAAMPTGGHYIFKRLAPDLQNQITLEQRDAVAKQQEEPATE